jgi:hypothetical protein
MTRKCVHGPARDPVKIGRHKKEAPFLAVRGTREAAAVRRSGISHSQVNPITKVVGLDLDHFPGYDGRPSDGTAKQIDHFKPELSRCRCTGVNWRVVW